MMLHVILTILKILGIIIAAILGIIILLILVVLFVPVRFKIKADYYSKLHAKVKLSWLFHILNAKASYDQNGLHMRARALIFTIFDSDAKPKIKKSKPKSKKNKTANKYDKPEKQLDVPAKQPERMSEDKTTKYQGHVQQDKVLKEQPILQSPDIETNTTKVTFFNKIRNILIKICDTIKNIFNKTIALNKSFREKRDTFTTIIQDEDNKEFVSFMKKQIRLLFRHIAPRKYRIYIKYGSTEPDFLGSVIAVVSILNGFTGLLFEFVPVFDENILEGEIFLQGRIRAFTVLLIAFRVYRNKQFKLIMNKFR